MKPGYKTTEFWLVGLGNLAALAGAYGGIIPGGYGVSIAAALSAIYVASRTIIKAFGGTVPANGS